MLGTRQIQDTRTSPYATGSDFCRIFEQNLNRLYLLAFLLTGDNTTAEECFVSGLEDSGKGNPVFREWAESWARRTIIQNAIQRIGPKPMGAETLRDSSNHSAGHALTERTEILRVIGLPAFERFVFVMTVLERYSEQECSLLLNCSRADVAAARTRALQQIGRSAELARKLTSIATEEQSPRENCDSTIKLGAISPLAATA